MTETMTMATAVRRAQIEANIDRCRETAMVNIVEIGRWLNTAKDEGVVGHGEWRAWVETHAGMSERNAQRAMQAARELPPGSPLEKLGIAKIGSLLQLEAGEREDVAARIGAQQLSSREVDAQVKAIRAERDEALRLVGEQKKRMREMEQNKNKMLTDAIARTRADVSRESEEELRRLKGLAESAATGRRQTEALLDKARARLESAREEAAALRRQLDSAQSKPDPEQARRIALLESQIRSRDAAIAQRETEIDKLSEKLDAAQTAAMRSGMQGEMEKPSPAVLIVSSIGGLMSSAGRAPAELAQMQGLDEETKEICCAQARLIGQWAMQIIAACGGEACV